MKIPARIEQQLAFFDFDDPVLAGSKTDAKPKGKFSDFVVYVDESGDHGMLSPDEKYPVFVLALCVFHKRYYCEKVVPALQYFKFSHFGHDSVVLHENEIRKEKGAFKFFQNRMQKESFLTELTDIIDRSNFILISSVIDKEQLKAKGGSPQNPYHLAHFVIHNSRHNSIEEKVEGKRWAGQRLNLKR